MSIHWVWIDLELTGLDLVSDTIVEISVILTDHSLTSIIEGPSIVINQPDEVLEKMSDFVKKMHTKSGLLNLIRASPHSIQDAETEICSFLQANNVENSTLAGNSVHMDRLFLLKQLPSLFHKFISPLSLLDISSIKQLYLLYKSPSEPTKKKQTHRSLQDIQESIQELKFYINSGFTNLLRLTPNITP